ncbi:MAG TPA: BatA domain-containing protein [Lacipirellulaceae bacterium]|nr:BatA domain-containing protein [Lacipirellulaceae bacterium]
MTFLQPWLLWTLPLAALPIIIHLIHQRRFQSIDWGAMKFLLEANRMSRGYARIRQWLILALRVVAIAALVLLISRPLASGWLGLAGGGRPDTTLILIDRSPSMHQQDASSVSSKLKTGVEQLARTLNTLGSGRWVVIDSVTNIPSQLTSPLELAESPKTGPASAAADLPAMLQAAHDYMQNNRTGQTEIWICSDLRANDWNAENGRWKTLRDSFQKFKQSVRFHLLAYPTAPSSNMSVRASDIQRRTTADSASLFLTIHLTRRGSAGKQRVPLQFEVDGARTETDVEMTGPELELKNHRIPLEANRTHGWGRVSIPADENTADNEFYFVYDQQRPRHAIVVAEDAEQARPLHIAAASAPDPAIKSKVEVLAPNQLTGVAWEDVALVLWSAPIPSGQNANTIRQLISRGGQVIFFPPRTPSNDKILGAGWSKWETPPEPIRVEKWRGDEDLWARTQSGAALPVGELTVRRYCGLSGTFASIASLYGGAPLVAHVTTDHGGVYFFATTTSTNDSSLSTNGVALYVAIQRALAAGAAQLSNARQLVAGQPFPRSKETWRKLAGSTDALSTEYSSHAGVYAAEKATVAVNRSDAEDRPAVLSDSRVAELFRGLDFDRVNDQAGNMNSLAREIWRMCAGAMLVAIVAEAGLCLPRPRRRSGDVL